MRRIKYKIVCELGHTVKGDKGDECKSHINRTIESELEDYRGVRRFEQDSSHREYNTPAGYPGSIISYYEVYVSNSVDLTSESERPKIGEVNQKIWRSLSESIEDLIHIDVVTENIEQVTTSISEENRTDIDLDDSIYEDDSGASSSYKTLRTIHTNEEFDKVFKEIMKQLRNMLSLDSQEYKLAKRLLEQEQREDWCCERCGRYGDIEIHHSMVRSSIRNHFRDKLSKHNGFLIDEETGEIYMDGGTVIKHIAEIVHKPEVLTPLCQECHRERHY